MKHTTARAWIIVPYAVLFLSTVLFPGLLRASEEAAGIVYHDRNGNGTRDAGESGISGVGVSNGREIVLTNGDGLYRIPVDDDCILFVIKPRDYCPPLDGDNLPLFYYTHKPAGSPPLIYSGVPPTGPLPKSVDFPLLAQKEQNSFRTILFGDSQTENIREIEFFAHDIVEDLIGVDAVFGVTLGDITNDDLTLFPILNSVVGRIGIPWHNVIGNHDQNYDAPHDKLADESYENIYGPNYYSFNYGPVHFLVLDDIIWNGPATEGWRGGNYTVGLGDDQLEFIRRDLELVPPDRLVILMMHAPLTSQWIEEDRDRLLRLMEKRPHCFSIAAHTHMQEHVFLESADGWNGPEPHHHLINVTSCGSWWEGALDETGIPHTTMRGGAPNGYSILTCLGNAYSVEFRAARRPAGYQINVHAPESITAAEAESTEVVANVFGGSEKSHVRFRLGDTGDWHKMEKIECVDPYFVAVVAAEEGLVTSGGRGLPEPEKSKHIWKALLPKGVGPGTHVIHVQTTDMFGHLYTGQRVIRIE